MQSRPLTHPLRAAWPFRTEQQLAEYEELRRHGYELLRQAHELFQAAVKADRMRKAIKTRNRNRRSEHGERA